MVVIKTLDRSIWNLRRTARYMSQTGIMSSSATCSTMLGIHYATMHTDVFIVLPILLDHWSPPLKWQAQVLTNSWKTLNCQNIEHVTEAKGNFVDGIAMMCSKN